MRLGQNQDNRRGMWKGRCMTAMDSGYGGPAASRFRPIVRRSSVQEQGIAWGLVAFGIVGLVLGAVFARYLNYRAVLICLGASALCFLMGYLTLRPRTVFDRSGIHSRTVWRSYDVPWPASRSDFAVTLLPHRGGRLTSSQDSDGQPGGDPSDHHTAHEGHDDCHADDEQIVHCRQCCQPDERDTSSARKCRRQACSGSNDHQPTDGEGHEAWVSDVDGLECRSPDDDEETADGQACSGDVSSAQLRPGRLVAVRCCPVVVFLPMMRCVVVAKTSVVIWCSPSPRARVPSCGRHSPGRWPADPCSP